MSSHSQSAPTHLSRHATLIALTLVTLAALLTATPAGAAVVGWGGRDAAFTPPALNGPVNAVLQLQQGALAGKYLLGGSFTDVGGNSAIDHIALLNADGTLDTTFVPPALASGSGSCVKNDGTHADSVDVLTLMEVQSTSGSAAAGEIYIGGNFSDAGTNSAMDHLVRVSTTGTVDVGFAPTDTGATSGTPTYTNCVHTLFTANGTAPYVTVVVGSQADGRLTKKVLSTGADADGFDAPGLDGAVTTGFYCSACSGNRIVVGGRFTAVDGNPGMNGLIRVGSDGTVADIYATDDGTDSGVPHFDDAVSSIALTSSGTSILVGGAFTDELIKVDRSTFERNGSFNAPHLNGDVHAVAVDPTNGDYVFGGDFTNAGGYPACDHVCVSDSDGTVADSDGRSFFAAPELNAPVHAVSIAEFPDDHEGQYLIGGDFTNVGSNVDTDRVARLNQPTPAVVTLNSSGGQSVGGADGIRTVYSNGQWQVYRGGTGQLYEPNTSPPDRSSYSQIALSLTAPGGGGHTVGPGSLDLSRMNVAPGYRFRPWDSVTATGGSAGSGSAASDLSVEIDGRTYTVHLSLDYTYPSNSVRHTYTVDIPSGNTYDVKLYTLYDSYLGGSDNGPGFYSSSPRMVGVSGEEVFEAIRYVSGPEWAGYASAHYYDVVFGNDYRASTPRGPGSGSNLGNDVITDPTNDNAFGVNWDFGSTAGTTTPAVYDFAFSDPATAVPTDVFGQVRVAWSDPPGLPSTPTNYSVTAFDGTTPESGCTTSAPTRTCLVDGLDPAVDYTFLVEGRSGGESLFTLGSNVTSPAVLPPDAPTITAAQRTTGSAGTLSVSPNFNGGAVITGYQYSVDSGSWRDAGAGPTVAISGLIAASGHSVRVRAVNSAGSGAASDPVNLIKAVPATPQSPTVRRANGATVATAFWTAPAANTAPVTAYRVQVINSGDTVMRTCVALVPRCLLAGLPTGIPLRARVAAANTYGYGDYSSPSGAFVITPALPGPPTVSLVSRSGRRLTIAVRPRAGNLPTSYTVRAVGDVTRTCTVTGSGGSCRLLSLSRNSPYTVSARAANSGGTSAWGLPRVFRTLP